LREIDQADARNRGRERQVREQLVEELNQLLTDRELFSDDQLSALRLRSEGRQLRQRPPESRTDEESHRLNRVALQAAFPRDIRVRPRQALQFAYFTYRLGPAIPLSNEQFQEAVTKALVVLQNGLLGPIGIFAAILVTASVIPNMFDEGSINLLLSKPISRTWLYLAKFVGGTFFTLISATYLLVGVWAVVGLRFEIWKSALITSIPVFVFVFVVYYSVSAFAGIIWRNAVVSVVVTVVFWLACQLVGASYDLTNALWMQPRRIIRIVPAGDDLVVVSEAGDVLRWSESSRNWEPILAPQGGTRGPAFARRNRLLGPIYQPAPQRLVAIERNFAQETILGESRSGYERAGTVTAPANPVALVVDRQGTALAVGRDGISRLVENPLEQSPTVDVFGLKIPVERLVLTLPGQTPVGPWRSLGPDDLTIDDDVTADLDPSDGSVFVASAGRITRLVSSENGLFLRDAETQLEEQPQQILIAAGGGVVIAANQAGHLCLLDGRTLQVQETLQPMGLAEPRFVAVSPDGQWVAVLYHNGKLWLRDRDGNQDTVLTARTSGGISAMRLQDDGRIYTADRVDRITVRLLPGQEVVQRYAPALQLLDRVYWYVLQPLYAVFPKPGKLSDTVAYVMTGKDALAPQDEANLQAGRLRLDPWGPVYHSAIFTFVMLGSACWYLRRQEL
jgi:hypothetical protein